MPACAASGARSSFHVASVKHRRLAPSLLVVAAAACSRIIAPPPPASPANTVVEHVVQGIPITVAAKSARALGDYGFVTKRFKSDSTWGWNKNRSLSARLRYTSPADDSTRIQIEFWGPCARPACFQRDAAILIRAIQAEEAPPG
jgi:hypothetical protein